jgi:hypothetical protein
VACDARQADARFSVAVLSEMGHGSSYGFNFDQLPR